MVDRKEEANTTRNTKQVEVDRVNNPPHYTTGCIECIDAMEAMVNQGRDYLIELDGHEQYCWHLKSISESTLIICIIAKAHFNVIESNKNSKNVQLKSTYRFELNSKNRLSN